MFIVFDVLKEMIYNHYNANTLQDHIDSLHTILDNNVEKMTISEVEYEVLNELIGDLNNINQCIGRSVSVNIKRYVSK